MITKFRWEFLQDGSQSKLITIENEVIRSKRTYFHEHLTHPRLGSLQLFWPSHATSPCKVNWYYLLTLNGRRDMLTSILKYCIEAGCIEQMPKLSTQVAGAFMTSSTHYLFSKRQNRRSGWYSCDHAYLAVLSTNASFIREWPGRVVLHAIRRFCANNVLSGGH